jgi:hypothetical protein
MCKCFFMCLKNLVLFHVIFTSSYNAYMSVTQLGFDGLGREDIYL